MCPEGTEQWLKLGGCVWEAEEGFLELAFELATGRVGEAGRCWKEDWEEGDMESRVMSLLSFLKVSVLAYFRDL